MDLLERLIREYALGVRQDGRLIVLRDQGPPEVVCSLGVFKRAWAGRRVRDGGRTETLANAWLSRCRSYNVRVEMRLIQR